MSVSKSRAKNKKRKDDGDQMSIIALTPAQRASLFLGLCIPIRLGLASGAKMLPPRFLPIPGIIGLALAVGFATRSMGGASAFGGTVWWNRPVHAALFALFGAFALAQNERAWEILVLDVIFGLFSFLANEHYRAAVVV